MILSGCTKISIKALEFITIDPKPKTKPSHIEN